MREVFPRHPILSFTNTQIPKPYTSFSIKLAQFGNVRLACEFVGWAEQPFTRLVHGMVAGRYWHWIRTCS